MNALHAAVPEAEILLLGTTDGYANIHAPNERVLLDEFEKAVAVEAEFFARFAETCEGRCVVTETADARGAAEPAEKTFLERVLDAIERGGNKMPHPAILFLALCVVVIVLSQVLVLARRQGDVRGRQAAGGADRGDVLRRLDASRSTSARPSPSRRRATGS